MHNRQGFTLVEMLVVISIIGILIVALVPVVRGAQTRAKEAAVKAQVANIETALANYAQSHGGDYPGVAPDIMSPFSDHALGDPDLYAGGGANSLGPGTEELVPAILGGFGHYISSSTNVFEQIKNVKDTPLAGNEDTARYFDALLLSDSIQEYPPNPFVSTTTGSRARMTNIFRFSLDMTTFNPADNFTQTDYICELYVGRTGTNSNGSTTRQDAFDTMRLFQTYPVTQLPYGVPLSPTWNPAGFSDVCVFGTGENDFFAPGDFAYVPILTSSAYPYGDSAATLENENYKWGVNVTGYLLFGYGSKTHKATEFEDEQREFVNIGLPGFGAPGIDTIYENFVLQCFEGAIYFSKKT